MGTFEEILAGMDEPLRSRLLMIRRSGEHQTTQTGSPEMTTGSVISRFECPDCQDSTWIHNRETNTSTRCKCFEVKQARRQIENSGISAGFRSKTVREYLPETNEQRTAKAMATDYIRRFAEIEKERNNGIALLGNPGAGKTHLTIAIANALLNAGIGVRYMPYRDAITVLMQVRFDDTAYAREIGPWKTCRVLLVDDLFKGAMRRDGVLGHEGTIMFEILNHRYLSGKPCLISSEYTVDRLLDMDEAVGSRVVEMAKGRAREAAR